MLREPGGGVLRPCSELLLVFRGFGQELRLCELCCSQIHDEEGQRENGREESPLSHGCSHV